MPAPPAPPARRLRALAAHLPPAPAPAAAQSRMFHASPAAAQDVPSPLHVLPTDPEVVARKLGSARLLILNRPKALNALSTGMCTEMAKFIGEWNQQDLAKTIIICSAPDARAFCAGGDIKTVVLDAQKGDLASALAFFDEEYILDHMIATIETPVISIMDGITMGGGVGLSVHAPIRIATERTLFAMPETAIGFFPDVGGSFFLPRLDGEIGTYLGLTGKRLKGIECLFAGIATHYVPSARVEALVRRLGEVEGNLGVVESVVEEFAAEAPTKEQWLSWSLSGDARRTIDSCFSANTVEEILQRLSKDGSPFALETLATLEKMSPTAMKVSLRAARKGEQMDVAEVFGMEFRLCREFVDFENNSPDLATGVTAVLITKQPDPAWTPPLSAIDTITDKYVEQTYFTPAGKPRRYTELKLRTERTYFEYPHRFVCALPRERDVEAVVKGDFKDAPEYAFRKEEVVDWFLLNWGTPPTENPYFNRADRKSMERARDVLLATRRPFGDRVPEGFGRGKVGLRERVEAVIEERCSVDADGLLSWKGAGKA
ncbi:ClpP/crotonase-like domain-containing protein [Hyaloraphidium curvatum]|nr:ClpP/crotonase-like domain-containing protein [Hyaloraphidium curvatum]